MYLYLGQPQLMDSAYRRILREYPTRDTADVRRKANQLMGTRFGILQVEPLPDWAVACGLQREFLADDDGAARYA